MNSKIKSLPEVAKLDHIFKFNSNLIIPDIGLTSLYNCTSCPLSCLTDGSLYIYQLGHKSYRSNGESIHSYIRESIKGMTCADFLIKGIIK